MVDIRIRRISSCCCQYGWAKHQWYFYVLFYLNAFVGNNLSVRLRSPLWYDSVCLPTDACQVDTYVPVEEITLPDTNGFEFEGKFFKLIFLHNIRALVKKLFKICTIS